MTETSAGVDAIRKEEVWELVGWRESKDSHWAMKYDGQSQL
jgi:hypothetical protein